MHCGPKIADESVQGTSSTPESPGENSETALEPTGAGVTETHSESSSGTISSMGTGNEFGTSMPQPSDMGSSPSCDPFLDQCPPGTKCSPYDPHNSGTWVGYRCQPLAPNPKQVYEECLIADDGADTCDKQLVCWPPGSDTGICFGLCIGSLDDPSCADPTAFCAVLTDGFSVCFPTCNPLDNKCNTEELCVPVGDFFECTADDSDIDGGLYSPCDIPDECESGLACTDSDSILNCDPEVIGCCVPWCDVSQVDVCPDGLACEPWWEPETEHPGTENIGICSAG